MRMIRAVALAVVAGALVAAGALYATGYAPWRGSALLGGAPARTAAPALPEELPVCTAMQAMGSEADWAELDPDFAAGKKALIAEDWSGAIAALKLAALRDPRNPDILNFIGYAHRRLKQFGPAMQHYQQALTLNRRHRSAHEHLGELYLLLGEPTQAEQQLALLEDICLIPCAETGDLRRAIDAYRARATQ